MSPKAEPRMKKRRCTRSEGSPMPGSGGVPVLFASAAASSSPFTYTSLSALESMAPTTPPKSESDVAAMVLEQQPGVHDNKCEGEDQVDKQTLADENTCQGKKAGVQAAIDKTATEQVGVECNKVVNARYGANVASRFGAQFSLELGAWIEDTVGAITEDNNVALLEAQSGCKVEEMQENQIADFMGKVGKESWKQSGKESMKSLTANETKELDRLQRAVDAGSFETKSYIGNKLRDFLKLDATEAAKYKKMNRVEAASFRASWAASELQVFRETRRATTSWRRVDTTRGHYYNFARLVKLFGGWHSKEAISGAIKTAQKCLCMGPPWIFVHPQSELVTYLLLEYSFQEDFEKSWQKFQDERSDGKLEPRTKNVAVVANDKYQEEHGAIEGKTKAPVMTTNAKIEVKKAKEASPASGKGRANDSKSSCGDSEQTAATLWKEAGKLKTRFQAASCAYMELRQKIRAGGAWSWAVGVNSDRLTAAMQAVKERFTDFHAEFVMTSDVSRFRKQFANAKCETELAAFLALSGWINSLCKVVSSLQRAHAEIQRA